MTVDASDGSTAAASFSSNQPWLTVSPTSGDTPATLTVSVDSSGLSTGAHSGTVTAQAAGFTSATLNVTLNVGSSDPGDAPVSLMLSTSANRSNPVPLEGQAVQDIIYVFTAPDEGVDQVSFWIDDPAMTGIPHQVEGLGPYDFAGTAPDDTAFPFDTNSISDGSHSITAEAVMTSGEEFVITSSFTVANGSDPTDPALSFTPSSLSFSLDEGGADSEDVSVDATDGSTAAASFSSNQPWLTVSPTSGDTPATLTVSVDSSGLSTGAHSGTVTAQAAGFTSATLSVSLTISGDPGDAPVSLMLSMSADRSGPVTLDGQTVQGDIYVFTAPDAGVNRVSFWVDDPTMTEQPFQVEGRAPYDLAGTDSDDSAFPFDTSNLPDGAHSITALVEVTGSDPFAITANFIIANGSDPSDPALTFSPSSLSFSVDEGGSDSADVTVDASDGSTAAASFTSNQPWLTVSPASGDTPATLTVSVDSSGLSTGAHSGTVTAEAQGLTSATLSVTLSVTSDDPGDAPVSLQLSTSANRSNPVPLDGLAVEDIIYVFTAPDTGVQTVEFWIDDPAMAGAAHQLEGRAPYDFAGTAPDDTAFPFDTNSISDGSHSITARVVMSNSEEFVITSSFTVANGSDPTDPALSFTPSSLSFSVDEGGSDSEDVTVGTSDGSTAAASFSSNQPWLTVSPTSGDTPATLTVSVDSSGLSTGTHSGTVTAQAAGFTSATLNVTLNVSGSDPGDAPVSLQLSTSSNRSNPVPLEGQAVQDIIYVFTAPDTGVQSVEFWIDDPSMTGTAHQQEGRAPYDFAGTASDDTALPFDTHSLADGSHSITAEVVMTSGEVFVVTSSFTVANGSDPSDPALSFTPSSLSFSVDEGGTDSEDVTVGTSNGSTAAASFSSNQPWLTVSPASGDTPATLTISADSSGLSAGSHSATVTAQAAGFISATLNVTLNVSGAGSDVYDLLLSTSPNRADPVSLQNQTVSGFIYVFTAPDINIRDRNGVEFFLDNPAATGFPDEEEGQAPYDFNSTAANGLAIPFDTATIVDGQHSITARIFLNDGSSEVITSTFTVSNGVEALQFTPATITQVVGQNGSTSAMVELETTDGSTPAFGVTDNAPWLSVSPASGDTPESLTISIDATGLAEGTYSARATASASGYLDGHLDVSLTVSGGHVLLKSSASNRSSPSPLAGQSVAGDIYVFVSPENGLESVDFFLDDPDMSGSPVESTNGPNFDFAGTDPDGFANPLDTTELSSGSHTITANLTLDGGGTQTLHATFNVDNSGGDCSPVPCGEIRVNLPYELSFIEDAGGVWDRDQMGTGFTYIDQPTNGTGYVPALIDVETPPGVLRVTTTEGLNTQASNSLDNALGVGIDAPSQVSLITTTMSQIPVGSRSSEQGGIWFGNDEDNFIKLVVISTEGGTRIQYQLEVDGEISTALTFRSDPINTAGVDITLVMRVDPFNRTVTGMYGMGEESLQTLGTFTPPGQFFSFDGARIDPFIGTDSFAGIFASHRRGPTALTYTFRDFSVVEGERDATTSDFVFDRKSVGDIQFPTSMVWGPDDRLYVTEMFGEIHALTFNDDMEVIDRQSISTLTSNTGPHGESPGARLTLGIAVDPASTPDNVILWVSHSGGVLRGASAQSSAVSKISGSNFSDIEHVITGLPRSGANHSLNSLRFGPDGRLYIAAGGNTGAGAEGDDPASEFGTRPEMPLSAAILVADVKASGFDGDCLTSDILDDPACDVATYGTGLRNAYDFWFHSNGEMYAPDNGLGVDSQIPPSPTPPCDGLGSIAPGSQQDTLHRILEGRYYGHPNPSRDECVFMDGSIQTVTPPANYMPPMLGLGNSRSANSIVEYMAAEPFCGLLLNELLISNFSAGDNITRVRLSANGLTTTNSSSLVGGFNDPLPLALAPNGTIFVGEFNANQVTALIPVDTGCWTTKQSLPENVLDAGGVAVDGKLYMVAGKTSSGPINTVRVYDPASNEWSSVANLPGSAVENPAVAEFDGKLYAFGGSTGPFSGAVNNAAVFDPATGNWSTLASMPTARGGLAAQEIDGKIYVVGGMDNSGASVSTVEVYDPAADSWSTVQSMGTARDNPGSAAIDGKLYIFGGRTRLSDGIDIEPTLATGEVYDPSTDSWSDIEPMPTGRRTMVVGTLNGKALVIGGEATEDGGSFPQNEEYDPASDTWRTLRPIPTGRHGAAAGTIDGVIYVAGGGPQAGGTFTDIVEAFEFEQP
ncbi:MAG: kelch repeat-containing protein [Dehalococcoidia bacterium]